MVNAHKFETEVGREVPQAKRAEYDQRYQARFQAQVRELSVSLNREYRRNLQGGDLTKVIAKVSGEPEARDAWNTKLRVEPVAWDPRQTYMVRSAGADERFDTRMTYDGISAMIPSKGADAPREGRIDVKIEHDHGPFNGLAEIAGSVIDSTAHGRWREFSLSLREISSGRMRAGKDR